MNIHFKYCCNNFLPLNYHLGYLLLDFKFILAFSPDELRIVYTDQIYQQLYCIHGLMLVTRRCNYVALYR